MNEKIALLKEEAFQSTEWEELDYDKILEKVVRLTVKKCCNVVPRMYEGLIKRQFGMEHE
jgi:hypothetical protein